MRAPGTQAGPPRASVIIPHLNTPDLLVRALQSVAAQRIDAGWFETIVVDNGSRLSLDGIRAAWPEVRFLVEPTPGPGPARNCGIAHARADILAFIDADVRALPGWLQAGLDALADDQPGPIGGDVRIDTGGRQRLSGVEAFECVFSFRQRRYIQREHYSVTANLMMRRKVFDAVGPFAGIGMAEDADFGRRARAAGFPTRYVPAMRALHPARPDLAAVRAKWQRLSHHALARHRAARRPMLAWRLHALAVIASAAVHAPWMLLSPRVRGLGNRLRGLGFLVAIRWHRGLDMLSLAREAPASGDAVALNWNR